MKREKEIVSKSYIWWDDNYGEMPHRKKKERNGGMGKITKSQWFSSWGGGNDLTVFFFFFFAPPPHTHPSIFYISVREVLCSKKRSKILESGSTIIIVSSYGPPTKS